MNENTSYNADINKYSNSYKKIQKKNLSSVKRFLIYIEIIFIVIMFLVSIVELLIGGNVIALYTQVVNKYYYESILFYIRGVDYLYEIKTSVSPDIGNNNFTKIKFHRISYITGIHLNKTSSPTTLSFKSNGTDTLTLDQPQTINYWRNLYYYKISYSQNALNFYFLNKTDTSKCGTDIYCGRYYGYPYCMVVIDGNSNNLNKCPFMNIYEEENEEVDKEIQKLKLSNEKFYIGRKKYVVVRNVTDKLNGFFFSIRFNYGEVGTSDQNETLSKDYISYYRGAYFDFSVSERYTVMSDEIDKDFDRAFQNSYFLPSIITNNNITKLYGNNPILFNDTPPGNFSLRKKVNKFPIEKCMNFFVSSPKDKTDYLTKIDLFINHLFISGPKFLGWAIIEIIYIVYFYIYFRGYLIFKEILTNKMMHLEKINEDVSEITKVLLSFFIIIVKLINSHLQLKNLRANLYIADYMNKNDCFKEDKYLSSSLKLYYDNVLGLKTITQNLIYILYFKIGLMIFYELFYIRYYCIKKKYRNLKKKINKNTFIENETDKKLN